VVTLSGGNLTVATGIAFTVRGNFSVGGKTLTLNAGSTFEMDASQAATPTTNYRINLGWLGTVAQMAFSAAASQ